MPGLTEFYALCALVRRVADREVQEQTRPKERSQSALITVRACEQQRRDTARHALRIWKCASAGATTSSARRVVAISREVNHARISDVLSAQVTQHSRRTAFKEHHA